jgi:hypothetical protein
MKLKQLFVLLVLAVSLIAVVACSEEDMKWLTEEEKYWLGVFDSPVSTPTPVPPRERCVEVPDGFNWETLQLETKEVCF